MATDSIFQTEEFKVYASAWSQRQLELAHRKAISHSKAY